MHTPGRALGAGPEQNRPRQAILSASDPGTMPTDCAFLLKNKADYWRAKKRMPRREEFLESPNQHLIKRDLSAYPFVFRHIGHSEVRLFPPTGRIGAFPDSLLFPMGMKIAKSFQQWT